MTKTAVELLQEQYDNCPESFLTDDDFDKAKEIQKQQMIDFGRKMQMISGVNNDGNVEFCFEPEKAVMEMFNGTDKKKDKNTRTQTALKFLVSQYVKKSGKLEIEDFLKAEEIDKHQHGATWNAAISAHDECGHNIAISNFRFDEYYEKTF